MTVPAPRRRTWRDRLADDRAAGAGMLVAAAGALVWANWPGSSYARVWTSPHHLLHLSLRGWVDQGLLVAFFAVVGLEIRREVVAGELRTLRRASIPVLAALAGMAVPALLYTLVVAGGRGAGGWGIPTATDVAFAVAALALVGKVPGRARVFLLTLAVADDLVAIAVLVTVYNTGVRLGWLLTGLAAVATLAGVWWTRVGAGAVRVALAALAWWSLLHAGVEAAVAGAALGAWGPARRPAAGGHNPRVRQWVARLAPAVNGVVLPVFAVANIGVVLRGGVLSGGPEQRIFLAVAASRVVGKPIGIVGGTLLARRLTGQADQPRVTARTLLATGSVAGIGFTVPLLIIGAALPPGALATAAIAGLLAGSILSVVAGIAVMRLWAGS